MNKESIDEAIDRYVTDRMAQGKKKAVSHFLAGIYLKQQRDEIAEALRKVQGMARYYIDLAKVTVNPLKGPELAWFASMVCVAVYACFLISIEEQRGLGIGLLSGTLANAYYLVRSAAKKWCDLHVMIAIYCEIVQVVDSELEKMVITASLT